MALWMTGRFKRWMILRSTLRPLVVWLKSLWVFVGLAIVLTCCLVMKSRLHQGEAGTLMSLQNSVASGGRSHLVFPYGVHEGSDNLPICPPVPKNLKGRMEVRENVTIDEAEEVTEVRKGGLWWPSHCQPRWRVAVIVPYRDRPSQIGSFLQHMHGFLQRQELNYSIYIVEQEGDDLFNRARLLNVGYLEAQKEGPWDCFAFHDVDMLPEDDRHLYHCSPQPRHLAVRTSNHDYKLVYYKYFGGACLMTTDQIEAVNGWSNIYWGWGGEDDDMWRRISFEDMRVWRYPGNLARYKTIKHKPQALNKQRYKTLARNTGRYPHDGLNSLEYELRSVIKKPLFTHLLAYVGSSSDVTSSSLGVTKERGQGSNPISSSSPGRLPEELSNPISTNSPGRFPEE